MKRLHEQAERIYMHHTVTQNLTHIRIFLIFFLKYLQDFQKKCKEFQKFVLLYFYWIAIYLLCLKLHFIYCL